MVTGLGSDALHFTPRGPTAEQNPDKQAGALDPQAQSGGRERGQGVSLWGRATVRTVLRGHEVGWGRLYRGVSQRRRVRLWRRAGAPAHGPCKEIPILPAKFISEQASSLTNDRRFPDVGN